MQLSFAMRAWSAVAPGLDQPMQWMQWLAQPACPQGEVSVDVSHIPPMARRRLGRLAKMAVSVADVVLQQAHSMDIPVVWASRYGDAEKSLALLGSQALGDPLSPTAFGLSVHNGVGAQHSILRGVRANAVCVASSHSAPEAAMLEAIALLHEGAREVLCVVYDEPLPCAYARFHDEPVVPMAWAALLCLPETGALHFSLHREAVEPQVTSAPRLEMNGEIGHSCLPHALEVLRFLIDKQQCMLSHVDGRGRWVWRRTNA